MKQTRDERIEAEAKQVEAERRARRVAYLVADRNDCLYLGGSATLPVVGTDDYRIGADGVVWTSRPLGAGKRPNPPVWRVVNPRNRTHSARCVCVEVRFVTPDGTIKREMSVPAMVLCAFVGEGPEGFHATHANDDPLDNHVANLRWADPGVILAGCDTTKKLTPERVVAIKARIKARESPGAIADDEGVSKYTIWDIKAGRSWKDV